MLTFSLTYPQSWLWLFNVKLCNWKKFLLVNLFPIYTFMCPWRVCVWLHKHMEKFEINSILIQCTPYCFFNIRKSDQFFVWYHCTVIVWHHLGMIIASMTANAMFLIFPIRAWNVMCCSTHYLNPLQIDYFYNSSTELCLFAKAIHLAN